MSAVFTGASGLLGSDVYRWVQPHFYMLNAVSGVAGCRSESSPKDDEYTLGHVIFNTIDMILPSPNVQIVGDSEVINPFGGKEESTSRPAVEPVPGT